MILPPTYIGSPRHMLHLCKKICSPCIFITFTCNSSWSEIKENMIYGQAPMDHHDIIARVFQQKQIRFRDVIEKYHIFETVRCWMYTIERQKIGLPHSHNLIGLHEKNLSKSN